MSTVQVELAEVKEIFLLLEKLQDFMHQPMNFETQDHFQEFVYSVYPEVKDAYYNKVWGWLPEEAQKEIEER